MTCSMYSTAIYLLWYDLYTVLQCFPHNTQPKILQLIWPTKCFALFSPQHHTQFDTSDMIYFMILTDFLYL